MLSAEPRPPGSRWLGQPGSLGGTAGTWGRRPPSPPASSPAGPADLTLPRGSSPNLCRSRAVLGPAPWGGWGGGRGTGEVLAGA